MKIAKFLFEQILTPPSLVTQPILQRRPNRTELRLMDSFIQILCRFQKSKRKVPPLSPLSYKIKKGVFFSNKFYFPEIFFFCHFSKSCSVFYILKTKKKFRNDQKNFPNIFFESSYKKIQKKI